jgi:hypothetical protein
MHWLKVLITDGDSWDTAATQQELQNLCGIAGSLIYSMALIQLHTLEIGIVIFSGEIGQQIRLIGLPMLQAI